MKAGLWMVAALVFALTLLLNLPAAFVARLIEWPAGWQPQAITGSVWNGHMEKLGSLGPLKWNLRPWAGSATLDAGFQRQNWQMIVSGWPWAWQAELAPTASVVTPAAAFVLDGQWIGQVRIQGRGTRCLSSEGALHASGLTVLSPWMVVLGDANLRVDCQDKLQVFADIQRKGEHHFEARLQPFTRYAVVKGQVQAEASVKPLMVQAGLLKAGDTTFEKILGGR
jgi:general secretion pathway protein N